MRVLDLFSGIGGFSLGLERAGMTTIAFCEQDKFCQQVLKKHWPDIPIYDDVRTLDGKQFRGAVDVVCGGFPCQPHSFSGQRKGSADARDVWTDNARIVCEVRPKFYIAENVLGLLSTEAGQYFGRILRDLAKIGYDAEWFNLPGGAFSCQHLRPRVWLVAYPNEAQLERGSISSGIHKEYTDTGYTRRGKDKPGVERMAYGIPKQMDRLGALGNAVVPQIPEIIGRAIMNINKREVIV